MLLKEITAVTRQHCFYHKTDKHSIPLLYTHAQKTYNKVCFYLEKFMWYCTGKKHFQKLDNSLHENSLWSGSELIHIEESFKESVVHQKLNPVHFLSPLSFCLLQKKLKRLDSEPHHQHFLVVWHLACHLTTESFSFLPSSVEITGFFGE